MNHPRFQSQIAERNREQNMPAASWITRHRPKSLDEMALMPAVRDELNRYVRRGRSPHLILSGPPGTGKTTAAELLAWSWFPTNHSHHVLRVSGPEQGGVDYVRSVVIPFVEAGGGVFGSIEKDWRSLVIYSEADGVSEETQKALLDPMELHAGHATFVVTTNYPERLSEALRSRCREIKFEPPPLSERVAALSRLCRLEGVPSDPTALTALAETHSDMRRLVDEVERYADLNAGILEADLSIGGDSSGEECGPPTHALRRDLLSEVRQIAAERGIRMPTTEVLASLRAVADGRWAQLTPKTLAAGLRAVGVVSVPCSVMGADGKVSSRPCYRLFELEAALTKRSVRS